MMVTMIKTHSQIWSMDGQSAVVCFLPQQTSIESNVLVLTTITAMMIMNDTLMMTILMMRTVILTTMMMTMR